MLGTGDTDASTRPGSTTH